MTEADALYQAILAAPDDDLPRLVYADWLEENGRADTAAFIRVQCELARVPPWDPLWVRCSRLDKSWVSGRGKSPLKADVPPGFRWAADKYRRGFPCRVQVLDTTLASTNAEQLFQVVPVDTLRFEMRTRRDIAPLMRHPRMACVRRIEFNGGGLSPEHLAPLLESPFASGVDSLRFEFWAVGENGLRAVITSPLATRLRELEMNFNFFRQWDDPLVAALDGVELPFLERLDLHNEVPNGTNLRRILDSSRLPRLPDLRLGGCEMREEGIRLLNGWNGCHQITRLGLGWRAGVGYRAMRAMAECDWGSLKVLELRSNPLGPLAGKALASAPWMSGLRILDLSDADLSDSGVQALASSPSVRNLLVLDLSTNAITKVGADALLNSPHLGNLLYLNVDQNNIPDGRRKALQKRFGPTTAKFKPTYFKRKR